jgi:hypothetical protein
MRLSKKCRRSRRASTRARRHRQLTGRLFAETLEKRLLLTTVTSVDPVEGSVSASVSTNISATFDEDIQAASATSDNFIVNSSSRAGPVAVSAAGPTITADPSSNFFPGERVEVTVTSGIQGTATAAVPKTWHFRTEVNSGSGQFVDSGQRLGANIGGRGRFADFDGDGDVDIVERGNVVWMNDGSGVFTDSGQTLGAGAEAVVGDLDGDGDLDVVGQNNVLLNDGSGVFTNTNQNLQGGATVSVGDLDGDGDLDLMQGVNYAADRLWFNDGNGNFSNSGQALSTSSSLGIEFGDFDGDGDLDAFNAINGFPSNQLWVNDGSGVFTNSGQAIGGFASSHDVSIGDVDGDGDLDAVVSNEYSGTGTRVWLNDGNGVFAGTGQQLDTNFRGRTTELGDLDGDGDLDLFVVILWNGSSVFLNDGAGNFTDSGQRLNFVNDIRARRVEGGAIADVDGDGDLDLFEANVGTGGSIIWINQNLQPNVSLSIDPATIAEAAGTATVTATLSAVHTQPVTVDLGLSGTATESDDYTTSGTQIVIATGATSGSVTITAVDDTDDEPDETVIVDIASVAGADKAGGAVTTTILDDDEPAPVPDVTLSVDNGAIAEDAGVATFTATLSVVTTVDVTIGLDFSGSAAASDYTASDTQIVIAAGATTGAVTVTAVQDTEDESDETVVVDIGSVTGGNESGSQQQTTTITDDDEPVVPDVSLAVDNATIPEEAGVATFTATLSKATTLPVTIDVEISGSASAGDDYNASGTQIVIAPGATTGSVTVTAIQDELDEPDETVTVDVSAVANGTESGTQQATTTITDDDEPQGFSVTSVTPTSTGFQVAFTNPIDTADLNLYDTQTAGLGPADVVLTGATSGPVAGSLVVFETMVEFIKSGDALTPDTYNVTLRSAADGFEDTGGLLLDGNGDGTGGDDFNSSFTVPEPAANAVTVGIPDIVRGPGQEVNLPADDTTGIPVTISEGTNVRAIDVRISFDPALLNITGATVGPDAPAGASVIVNSLTPGLAIVVYFATAPLPAGEGNFVNLQATVPEANASENYRRQQVLDVHDVIVSDGNDNESPAIANDALHVSTFFGDVSANGRINAADAAQVARNAALIDGGFAGTPLTDPGVVGDISGNGRLNAADASLVAQFAALIGVPQIPPIPGGVVITGLPADRVPVAEEADSPVSALSPEGNSRANYPAIAVDAVLADYPYDTADDEARTLELEDAIAELLSSDL